MLYGTQTDSNAQMVKRMVGPGAVSASVLARQVGMSQPTLPQWLHEAQLKEWRQAAAGALSGATGEALAPRSASGAASWRRPLRPEAEHTATGPCLMWSWDITYLKGPVKGAFLSLYLVVDDFSRRIMGFEAHEGESSEHAGREAAACSTPPGVPECPSPPPRVLEPRHARLDAGRPLAPQPQPGRNLHARWRRHGWALNTKCLRNRQGLGWEFLPSGSGCGDSAPPDACGRSTR
ncbi:putative transposase [Corallococcus coralloides DSM 2259]|uniref:Putative transposase n=1 Tax=Corallococcus coralloides (strain ATCC 25202 / DSM 2259 / NBRC 100086 / M2) TaxID=1144275 RepID=H8MJM4_CORCM|nr:putative transposase [Corallococcus coralloides DSM 2259]